MRRVHFRNGAGDFYENFFDARDRDAAQYDHRKIVRQATIARFLQRAVAENSSVLDVGCGLGDVLPALVDSYRTSAMDFSQRNVEFVKESYGGRLDARQGIIYAIPFDNESQDVCICLEVLEHIEDDGRALTELCRVLKTGGILIASVPSTYYWPDYLDLIGHYRHYTRESLVRLLEEHGLRSQEFLPNYPRWEVAYARRFVLARIGALTLGRITGSTNVYRFCWPWSEETALERAYLGLQPLQAADEQADPAKVPTSTFVVAVKV